eukprot:263405-Amphidinium_carterae.1
MLEPDSNSYCYRFVDFLDLHAIQGILGGQRFAASGTSPRDAAERLTWCLEDQVLGIRTANFGQTEARFSDARAK